MSRREIELENISRWRQEFKLNERTNAARLNIKSRCIDSGKDFIGVYGSEQHKARRSKTNKVRRGTDACHFSETKPK